MTLPATRIELPTIGSPLRLLRVLLPAGLLVLTGVAVSFLPAVERQEFRVLSGPGSLAFLRIVGAIFGLALVVVSLRRNRLRRLASRLAADCDRVLADAAVLVQPCDERRWYAPLLAVLAVFGFGVVLLAFLDPPRYEALIAEDGVVEYATAGLFAAAALVVFFGLLRAPSRATIAKIVYGLGVLFLVVCAGEEISWGQRLFGFASPEAMEAVNKQGETNLHDIGSISVFANAFFVLTLGIFLLVPRVLRRVPQLHAYLAHYHLPRVHPGVARLFLVGLGVWIVIGLRFGTLGFHPFSVWGHYTQLDDEMFEFIAAYCFFAFALLDRTCRCASLSARCPAAVTPPPA